MTDSLTFVWLGMILPVIVFATVFSLLERITR